MKKILTLIAAAIVSLAAMAQEQELSPAQKFANENNLTPEQLEAINKVQAFSDDKSTEMKKLVEEYRSTQDEQRKQQIEAEYDKLEKEINSVILETIKANRDNQVPAFFAQQIMYSLDLEELKEFCAEGTGYYNNPAMDKPKRVLSGKLRRVPGQKMKDLEENDLQGNPHKLSEYVGKGNYVLVDFWASWCGPCRAEMPKVKECYDKYHSKGFEIVGLSFDNKKEAWEKAINDLGLNWIHLSDLQGWKSVAAETYGVFSIPQTVLFDPNGIIVQTDLRGEQLEAKLAEIYGE